MLRRILSLALALSVAILAPLPLSACALLASLPGDCSRPVAKAECGDASMAGMPGTVDTNLQLTAPADRSCCHVTAAPLPEAQSQPPAPTVNALPVLAVALYGLLDPTPRRVFASSPPGISPPEQQSLLCVFLI
jgi:hypothetical protein